MATNTLGEFSDGEDDFVFEIDENLGLNNEDVPNIDDNEVLTGLYGNDDDDDLIRNINEKEVLAQTGRGEKRKSDDEEPLPTEQGEDYYHIESRKKYYSKKFGMTATDHKVRFNNVLADFDLLESHESTQKNFPSFIRGCNLGHEPQRPGTFHTTFRAVGYTYIHTFPTR